MKAIFAYCITVIVLSNSFAVAQQQSEFESLFNGKDLSGWYGMKTLDPRKISAMGADELVALKEQAVADTVKHWTVEGDEIVNDGAGPFLTSEREFSDFELMLEYKTVANADSGVYLKATPQVQIWDFTEAGGKWDIGADKGSGGLWNNSKGRPGKDPLELADHPFGEWNSMRIIQVGSRTTVYLNGKLVVDHAIMENYWDRKLPIVKSGPIQLQTHGGEIRWRNIKVRELDSDAANKILAAKNKEGLESIFNGENFDGWAGAVDNYLIKDGYVQCKPDSGGNLFTKQEYGDFHVRFEFALPPKGNNGLAIRYPGEGDTAYVGMCELQILGEDYPGDLDPRQFHGSAYGMCAATRGYLRETGQWNFQEVIVRGSTIKVELNGSIILDCDLSKVTDYLADRKHPGKERTKGHFGFAGHNSPVKFRNIFIKRLD